MSSTFPGRRLCFPGQLSRGWANLMVKRGSYRIRSFVHRLHTNKSVINHQASSVLVIAGRADINNSIWLWLLKYYERNTFQLQNKARLKISKWFVIFIQSRKKGNRLAQIGLRWPMTVEKQTKKKHLGHVCWIQTHQCLSISWLSGRWCIFVIAHCIYIRLRAARDSLRAICVNSNQQLSFHLCFSIFLHFLIHTLIFRSPKIWIIHPALMQKCNISKLNAMIYLCFSICCLSD